MYINSISLILSLLNFPVLSQTESGTTLLGLPRDIPDLDLDGKVDFIKGVTAQNGEVFMVMLFRNIGPLISCQFTQLIYSL